MPSTFIPSIAPYPSYLLLRNTSVYLRNSSSHPRLISPATFIHPIAAVSLVRSGEQPYELFWIVQAAPLNVKSKLDRLWVDLDGLSVSLKEACCKHVFHGISFPNEGPYVSHLMYADDVTFIGEWSEMNLINLNRLLRCYYLASGLRVNLSKSKVFGIGVEKEEVDRFASILHCEPNVLPCSYLGLPLGANMKLAKHWDPIVDKFKKKLSVWKAKNLSFGGRVTLMKSVLGSLSLYYFSIFKAPKKVVNEIERIRRHFLWSGGEDNKKIHWVSWDMVAKAKVHGGLGVGSLRSLNLALLAKWWWRLKVEKQNLWAVCIKAIHNVKGGDGSPIAKKRNLGILGNGQDTLFWKDRWCGPVAFKDRFPKLYGIESNKNCLVSERITVTDGWNTVFGWKRCPRRGGKSKELEGLLQVIVSVNLASSPDKWIWKEDASGLFSVSSLRRFMENQLVTDDDSWKFSWVNWVPLKVNCFVWRLLQDRLPVAVKLVERGVNLISDICPLCKSDIETVNHVFFECSVAKHVWQRFVSWWKLSMILPCSRDSLREILVSSLGDKKKEKLRKALLFAVLWCVWKARNDSIFRCRNASPFKMADDIMLSAFNWIKFRSPFSNSIAQLRPLAAFSLKPAAFSLTPAAVTRIFGIRFTPCRILVDPDSQYVRFQIIRFRIIPPLHLHPLRLPFLGNRYCSTASSMKPKTSACSPVDCFSPSLPSPVGAFDRPNPAAGRRPLHRLPLPIGAVDRQIPAAGSGCVPKSEFRFVFMNSLPVWHPNSGVFRVIGGRQYIVFRGHFLYTQRLKGVNVADKVSLNPNFFLQSKKKPVWIWNQKVEGIQEQ
ncbi:hypothetical protein L2E82_32415 [Cichorium intybus]|uniref:Uncharacterized protein n=1 Tax=Cichorium intybus TaxID=13427 RepID=A0ACB9BJ16_CICIN|nr:hypothetical protein L2E82_32415 [Cichorium intybus]